MYATQIADLRSQQVRDTCQFLMVLSTVTKDNMRFLLRETFEAIFLAAKIPNKVMAGYVHECIIFIIRHSTFKSSIQLILAEIKDGRSKVVRERSYEYMNEMLMHWELSEKDVDLIQDGIRFGLEDASVKGREISRNAYLTLREKYPRKADKVKLGLPSSLRSKIEKFELEHEGRTVDTKYISAEPTPRITGSPTKVQESFVSSNSLSMDDFDLPDKGHQSKREAVVDDAVTSIQAIIRGNLARRQSSLKSFSSFDRTTSDHSNMATDVPLSTISARPSTTNNTIITHSNSSTTSTINATTATTNKKRRESGKHDDVSVSSKTGGGSNGVVSNRLLNSNTPNGHGTHGPSDNEASATKSLEKQLKKE